MAERPRSALLDVDGPAAPPRRNGEIVFAAPWESRLFGLTIALHRAGRFEWEEFRGRLIAEIGVWEAGGHADGEWSYWRCWQWAFEGLLATKDLCAASDLDRRAGALVERGREPTAHRPS